MPDVTDRYALPLLSSGQAHKEVTHNEALVRIDALVQCSVVSATQPSPPATPQGGAMWIIPAGATGAWAQHIGQIALWQAGAWAFLRPSAGCCTWVESARTFAHYDGSAWRVGIWPVAALEVGGERMLAAPQPAIAGPQGGAAVDVEARAALNAILQALRAHRLIHS